MKKNLVAIASVVALSGNVIAQDKSASNVTFYGIADIGLLSVSDKAGANSLTLNSGLLQSSRIGVRGNVDIGNSLNGLVVLESGVNVDTGASASATTLYNRQAYVGLSSATKGTLTAGRQYTPIYDQLILTSSAPVFGFQAGAVDGIAAPGASAVARYDNTLSGTRIDNSIKYTSPNLDGFRVVALLGLGEVAGSPNSGQTLSAAVGYQNPNWSLGFGYLTDKCKAVTGCGATEADNSVVTFGGTYKFSAVKLLALYSTQKNAKSVRDNNADVVSLTMQVPSGAWTFSANYQIQDDQSKLGQDVRQMNWGALYTLDQRATVYLMYSNQSVRNNGKASMALATSSNDKQDVFGAGIRFTF